MQASEIQQRFNSIEQAISQAAQTCITDSSTPQQLHETIQKLDQQSSVARDIIESQDVERIRECVENMEMLGDEAKRVCRTEQQLTPALRAAVIRVHDELSDLKHQLH